MSINRAQRCRQTTMMFSTANMKFFGQTAKEIASFLLFQYQNIYFCPNTKHIKTNQYEKDFILINVPSMRNLFQIASLRWIRRN